MTAVSLSTNFEVLIISFNATPSDMRTFDREILVREGVFSVP